MSTTLTRRTHAAAWADAEAFQRLFAGSYERWEIAGSVRRGKADVGDVEHVVIPAFDAGLFDRQAGDNHVWGRLDRLAIESRGVARHVYGTGDGGQPLHRWGRLYRGVDFRGFNHEIFVATPDNWGSKFAIATGPAEFSKMLVTKLHRNGYRNHQGQVWRCSVCPMRVEREDGRCPADCTICDGTGLKPMTVVPVPTEQQFFALAGVAWAEPGERR